MGTIIGYFTDTNLPIYKSSKEEMENFDKAMSYNQYSNTFYTPNDNCEYKQIEGNFSSTDKYEVVLVVLGDTIKFKTTMEREDDNVQKRVRLHYLKKGKATKQTKEICIKYYNK